MTNRKEKPIKIKTIQQLINMLSIKIQEKNMLILSWNKDFIKGINMYNSKNTNKNVII